MASLTPLQIVEELDRYVVGQAEAKRAIAVAIRNRERRRQLPPEVAREITPKNILMIGPTGVGKTEIARRVADLVDAPFIKVEATKFTEAGYVGRDVESIVGDLVEDAAHDLHENRLKEVESRAEGLAKERLVSYLVQQRTAAPRKTAARGEAGKSATEEARPRTVTRAEVVRERRQRKQMQMLLDAQQIEDQMVDIEVTGDLDGYDPILEFRAGMTPEEMNDSFNDFVDAYAHVSLKRRWRRVSVREARRILTREEAGKLVDWDEVIDEACERCEEAGVVFIDELDKVCGRRAEFGPDVSGEGVQRDLLPIVEGSTVMTRYGPVKTDYMLFVAAGSFHHAKPSDLIPELQGRFPLRVELASLGEADFVRILTEPANALTKQYQALLSTEGVTLEFTEDGIRAIARTAVQMNERMENIGARRLHTIIEKVLEELSYSASERQGETVTVDAAYIDARLGDLVRDEDLSRFIL
jgi:ATP-dependent HslUV protease ATP-binding subunit HslU